jgi:hypothetical protein
MMATLRKWLTAAKFDWVNGVVIYDSADTNWVTTYNADTKEVITGDHPILDQEFDSGHGAGGCPSIFAKDSDAVYFPCIYDGSTWLEKIMIDPKYYLRRGNSLPYVGL